MAQKFLNLSQLEWNQYIKNIKRYFVRQEDKVKQLSDVRNYEKKMSFIITYSDARVASSLSVSLLWIVNESNYPSGYDAIAIQETNSNKPKLCIIWPVSSVHGEAHVQRIRILTGPEKREDYALRLKNFCPLNTATIVHAVMDILRWMSILELEDLRIFTKCVQQRLSRPEVSQVEITYCQSTKTMARGSIYHIITGVLGFKKQKGTFKQTSMDSFGTKVN
ncbi:hypothetical protein BD560DRAFT_419891 [Blakeslea trispora]|nr:hypothetical protein BD560DRAFT_419891 [Blakeslea trispora]